MWARGFRPFFLLAALYAAVAPPAWIAAIRGLVPAPAWLDAPAWHGHEMIFGFVGAAVAGFLLTAVPVWTGRAPLQGPRLAGLAVLWLAGRAAFWASGLLPPGLVAAVDAAFLPALAVALAPSLLARDQRRNLGILAAVAGLAAANLAFHLGALGWIGAPPSRLLRVAVDLVVVLLVVIGGRITPAFTQNTLRREGLDATLRARPALAATAAAAAAVAALASLPAGAATLRGVAALVAGACVVAALQGWRSASTRHDPLLWSLHLGRAWLGVGLLASGLASFGWAPETAALHLLTAGAMGTTILSVAMRVALGHTGRALVALPGSGLALGLASVGAALRVAAGFAGPVGPSLWLPAALCWSGAFAFFAWRYGPLLLQPRPDGRPG